MTDPVDTDALRARADDLSTAVADPYDCEPMLRAAADEVDRLRGERVELVHVSLVDSKHDELRDVEADRDRLRAELDAWEPAWRNMRDQRDQALAKLAELPHESGCQFSFLPDDKPRRCTCWKAELS